MNTVDQVLSLEVRDTRFRGKFPSAKIRGNVNKDPFAIFRVGDEGPLLSLFSTNFVEYKDLLPYQGGATLSKIDEWKEENSSKSLEIFIVDTNNAIHYWKMTIGEYYELVENNTDTSLEDYKVEVFERLEIVLDNR